MRLSLQPALLLLGFSSAAAAAPSNFTKARVLGPQCSDPLIKDASAKPAERWEAADTQNEFNTVSWKWMADRETSPLGFSAYVAEYFDAKESMICENVGDGPCKDTVRCDEVSSPAGFMALNSLVQIHLLQSNVYEALQDAMNEMQNSMSAFQETFSPPREAKNSSWLVKLLDGVQLFVGLCSGWSFNVALKGTKLAMENANRYGQVKDAVNSAVSYGVALGKSHINPTKTDLQNDLTTVMGEIFSTLVQGQIEFIKYLFGGEFMAVGMLGNLVRDGAALNLAKHIDRLELIKEAQKMMYALMLPLAWRNSPVEIGDAPKRIFPMILMVPDDCVKSGDDLHWMVDEEKSEKMAVCYDGHTFFVGFPTFTGYDDGEPTRVRLWALPGGEHEVLDKKRWGGLTLDDLVISVYEGYKKNGYRSGYAINVTESAADGDGINLGGGVRTPGLVSLPICTPGRVFSEARDFGPAAYNYAMDNDGKQYDGGPYPCGEGILTGDEMKEFGFE